jgi:hypothetical protein
VEERDHRFVRAADGRVFGENELWRRTVDRRTGETLSLDLLTRNHAEVATRSRRRRWPTQWGRAALDPVLARRMMGRSQGVILVDDVAVVIVALLAIAGLVLATTLASGIWLGWWRRRHWRGNGPSEVQRENESRGGPDAR